MTRGVRQTLAVGVATVGVFGACFNPAKSAGERMERSCGFYARSLEASSVADTEYHLGDAAHWAELATVKDEGFEAVEAALGHMIEDIDGDDVRPDAAVLADARSTMRGSCDDYATEADRRRISTAS